jgi:hypothetical protein
VIAGTGAATANNKPRREQLATGFLARTQELSRGPTEPTCMRIWHRGVAAVGAICDSGTHKFGSAWFISSSTFLGRGGARASRR